MTLGYVSVGVPHRCAGNEGSRRAGRWSPWSPSCIVATEKQAGRRARRSMVGHVCSGLLASLTQPCEVFSAVVHLAVDRVVSSHLA